MKSPEGSNFCRRFLQFPTDPSRTQSTTCTTPSGPTARWALSANWPSPPPWIPALQLVVIAAVQISAAPPPFSTVTTGPADPLSCETLVSVKRAPLNSIVKGPPLGPVTATLPGPMFESASSALWTSDADAEAGSWAVVATVAEGGTVSRVKVRPLKVGTLCSSLTLTLPEPSATQRATPLPVAVAGLERVMLSPLTWAILVPAEMPAPVIVWPSAKKPLVASAAVMAVEPDVRFPVPAASPLMTPPPKASRKLPSESNFCTREPRPKPRSE